MATFCDMALRPPVSRLSLSWDSDNKLRSADIDANGTADYPVGGSATTPTFRYVYASYIDEPVVRKDRPAQARYIFITATDSTKTLPVGLGSFAPGDLE